MRNHSDRWSTDLDRTTYCLAIIGGLCLLAIVAIVSAGVVARYAFGSPLLGVNEIVQLTAVALVMSALPYCTFREEHVAVDVFETMLGRWGRFAGDILTRLLSASILSVLTYRAVLKALDAWKWGDATNMLRMPIWPFYTILALGAGLCVLVFVFQLVLILFVRGAK